MKLVQRNPALELTLSDLGLSCGQYRNMPRWKRLLLLQRLSYIGTAANAVRADGPLYSYCGSTLMRAGQTATTQAPMQLASVAIGLVFLGGVWFLLTNRKAFV